MEHGDFTTLAKHYKNRTGYSSQVIKILAQHTGATDPLATVADVGAGTGKLTENLAQAELNPIIAVEPNDAMRKEGKEYTSQYNVDWRQGSGEETGLEDSSVQWVLMASSFHWVDKDKALKEFHRILRPGGFFTALWNPRDLENSELHGRIEKRIYEIASDIKRVSSGSAKYTQGIKETLLSTGHFENVVFVEGYHDVHMSKERYMSAWRSVNDIQHQAGPEKWEKILSAIEQEISDQDEIVTSYKTRSWTVQRVD
ncbi:MAG: class I SAM-dependent methyltransferase [Proteobacteria bacterium]|nr:class I SAM-dependent methyltransferase [Pseudomonadota bacterium]